MSYGEYNGDTVHDMWVDSNYSAWTGETPYLDSFGGDYYGPGMGKTYHPPKITRLRMRLNNLRGKAEHLRTLHRKNETRRTALPPLSNRARRRLANRQLGIKEELEYLEIKIAETEQELRVLEKARKKRRILSAIIFAIAISTLITCLI